MSDPRASLLRLNAALDGELGAMDHAAFERDMRDDPTLAAEYRRLVALRDAVKTAAPREAAPSALAERIAALAAPVAAPPLAPLASRARRQWSARGALALAASLGIIGFAAGVAVTSIRTSVPMRGPASALVADYARATIAGQPFDIASSDRHTVKPWLASRTTVSANIVDLAAQGYVLAGGRVAVVDRVPAPTLVYRHNEHFVAVTELPVGAKETRGPAGIETIDGYHVARWTDPDLGFIAVTDADEAALAGFVAAFREARKPAGE
jgi:anti-sigma factor RsiW